MNSSAKPRSVSRWLSLAPLLVVGVACSQSVSLGAGGPGQASDARPIEIKHDPCDVESKSAVRVDANNDGKSEITRVMSGSREVCRAVDLNFDGRMDSYVYLDDQGQMRRRESDFDRDGVIDEIATFQGGKLVRKDRETNLDGKLDTWDFYQNDVLVRRERDSNADGRVDQWWSFPDPAKLECAVVETDADGDGKPDTRQDVCKEREASQAAASAAAPPAPPPPAPPSSAAPTVASPPADAGPSDSGGRK
ncbi:MAG: hypothetical protein HY898_04330 [Deltaproteobacteria bacterium]|nr:hypothetical protein [Deltaproteobacteria bacterium]